MTADSMVQDWSRSSVTSGLVAKFALRRNGAKSSIIQWTVS